MAQEEAVKVVLLYIYILVVAANGQLELPTYIKACSKSASDFEECSLQHAKDALTVLIKGDRTYSIPSLNPLVLSSVELDAGNFKISFEDLKVYGFDNMEVKKVKFNLNKNELGIQAYFDRLSLIGKYKCSGKILVMPIEGEGNVNITAVKLDLNYFVNYKLEQKNGEEYISFPDDAKVDYTVGRVYFNLENLFNGNKQMGDATLEAMNQEWDKVIEMMRPVISETISTVVKGSAGQLTEKIPVKYIFLD